MATVGPQLREAPLPSKLMELLDRVDVHTSLTYYETTSSTEDEITSSAEQARHEAIEALRFLIDAKKRLIEHIENTISEDSPRMQEIAAMSSDIRKGLTRIDAQNVPHAPGDDSALDEEGEAIRLVENLMSEMRETLAQYALAACSEVVEEGKQRILLKKKELAKMTFLLGLLQPEDGSDRPACSDRTEAGVDQGGAFILAKDERKTIIELVNGLPEFLGKTVV